MPITTLKRFEFSAARGHPSAARPNALTGDNFTLWVGVGGPVQPVTGMVINITELKATVQAVLDRYDHHNLNRVLNSQAPTTPELARALWADLAGRFAEPLQLAALDLQEQDGLAAAGSPAQWEAVHYGGFSAAHRTDAPRLSAAENQALYGICNNPAGHGHNYRVAVRLPAEASLDPAVWAEFDHRNLSNDIPDLRGRNVVTEALAELIARRLPLARQVRVWELPDFFADYRPAAGSYALGRRYRFSAAHRLHSPALSAEENARVYAKCNRPDPHGHTYQVEVVVAAPQLDPRTETAFDLAELDRAAAAVLGELNHTYLDVEVDAFRQRPSTGENIALHLHQRFTEQLGSALESVTLWETANNQFRHGPALG